MWCTVFFPVSQHQTLSNCSYFSPNQQKRSTSLSCGFLFPDSLVKNSMSGHPWHTNLPSIPHLAHLWQQYGLLLYPLPPLVNTLKQMFYDCCLRHLTLAPLCGVHQSLYCLYGFYLPALCWRPTGVPRVVLNSARLVIQHTLSSCLQLSGSIPKVINHDRIKLFYFSWWTLQ